MLQPLIYEWQQARDKRSERLADALHALGVDRTSPDQQISDAHIELQVGRLPHDRTDETTWLALPM